MKVFVMAVALFGVIDFGAVRPDYCNTHPWTLACAQNGDRTANG